VALTIGLAVLLGTWGDRFVDTPKLAFQTKLDWAARGPSSDLVILGDSQAMASLSPTQLKPFLSPGTRVRNYALPGSGPALGEVVLRRYLGSHEPPRLVVLAYTPQAFLENAPVFNGLVLGSDLRWDEVIRIAYGARRPGYLLDWAALRVATFSHREDLGTLVVRQLFAAERGLRRPIRNVLGRDFRNPANFRWVYVAPRSPRNRTFLDELERENGWRLWPEYALPNGLPDNASWPREKLVIDPDPRETAGLRALIDLCMQEELAVFVAALALPEVWMRRATSQGGLVSLEQVWADLAQRFPPLDPPIPAAIGLPHSSFADPTHLNQAGVRRYVEWVAPKIANAYSKADARGPAGLGSPGYSP